MEALTIIRCAVGRERYRDYLSTRLPEAILIVDEEMSGARNCFHRALHRSANDPCIHMEDDVVISSQFEAMSKDAIDRHPSDVIQFFSMRKDDVRLGSRWDRGARFSMNQCFYLPAGMARDLLDYFPNWHGQFVHKSANDIFIGDFLKSRKLRYFIHVPSLVQHRNCVSVIDSRRSRNRQSATFAE